MRLPSTLLEFQGRFPDEESCWRALYESRWASGFVCPRCQGSKGGFIASRRLMQCGRCRYQISVTAGTILHGTRTPLRAWLLGMFLVARRKQGVSALQFQHDTGIGSYQTAWTLLHKLRAALSSAGDARLGGVVEVDETFVGATRELGQPGGRRAGRKTIVACAVEHRGDHAGRLRLATVGGFSFERDLGPFVRSSVDPARAELRSDGYWSYLPLRHEGFRHDRRVQGHRRRSTDILPWVHLVFTNLKAWLRGTFHGVSRKHMQSYLDEFAYRFNLRGQCDTLFPSILQRATVATPLTYRQLVAERVG